MSFLFRILRIFSLVAVCCSAAFADMHPGPFTRVADASSTADLQPTREKQFSGRAQPQLGDEPFGLSQVIAPGDLPEKWSDLQSRIRDDEKAVAACRADESVCSPAARRFLSIVDVGRKHEGRAQVGLINRAVNLSIKPTSDWAQYGYADFWASPLQTLASGAGDCEDYAIVKYAAFRELGFDANDLRLVIVHDDKHQADHAIVAVRYDQHWLILDNRTMAILDSEDAGHYHALFALDQQGARKLAAAVGNSIINR